MSQENQSYLRFSLEESVWFQKGQEVAELLSISLDPIITVLESDQYVTIRGSLELSGEYKPVEEGNSQQEENYSILKFVHSVEEREEGLCEFVHRFPVDITIPNNRIQSLEELDVTVDSFDYLLPERGCLNLTAELTISGLYGEQQNAPLENEEQENALVYGEEAANEQEYPELQPLYRSPQEEQEEDWTSYQAGVIPNEKQPPSEEYEPFEAEARKQPKEEHNVEAELTIEEEGTVWENPLQSQETKVPDVSFAAQRSEQSPALPEPEYLDPIQYEADQVEIIENEVETEESSSSSSSSAVNPIEALKKKITKKKSMSISEFLARKSDHEQLAKLKVCIVQQGDTLDSLADRYEMSIQQILKVNHLEANQDVYEGQVLYIPVSNAHHHS